MNREQRVAALIANSNGRFTNEDQSWLLNVPESRLSTLEAQTPPTSPGTGAPTTGQPSTPTAPQPSTGQPSVPSSPSPTPSQGGGQGQPSGAPSGGETRQAAASTASQDPEEYLRSMPVSVAETVREGMRVAAARREESVNLLKAHGKCKFTENELRAMSQVELDNLVELAGIVPESTPVNFGGRGVPREATKKIEVPPPPDSYAVIKAAHGHK